MKIDGIATADLASHYYYLEQLGLNTYFTPTAVEDNSGQRFAKETGWRAQDLQSMVDKLDIAHNKYFIIRLMKRGDILFLLGFLDKDQLVQAMDLFPRSRLIQFIHSLPKEMILKMLLSMMSLRTLMQFFPTEIIFNILRSKRMEVSDFVRGFENMPLDVLQRLMWEITGQNADKFKHKELLGMFQQLKKDQIIEGMKKMDQKNLFEFIFAAVQKDPELMMMIPRGEMMKAVAMMPKPHLVEMFQLLPENLLIEFLSQLPDKFLALAASQLDDNTFAAVLMNRYPDLIAALTQAA